MWERHSNKQGWEKKIIHGHGKRAAGPAPFLIVFEWQNLGDILRCSKNLRNSHSVQGPVFPPLGQAKITKPPLRDGPPSSAPHAVALPVS
uniref:Uncharacterized protein n=1 Tax=Nymphaea colorata TaxID=210225 RepID=A0A5K0XNF9_9MAGN